MRRVYHVTYNNTNRNQNTKTSAFVTERVALMYLRNEPWIADLVRPLCSTQSYKQVFFGEGAKSPKDLLRCASESGVQDIFWHSADNHAKIYTEGAVANMLFHMNLSVEAEQFRSSVIKPDHELLSQINLPIIISVTGCQSAYTHVVVVLQGIIFDFETKAPYPLWISNVEYICGPKNPYQKLVRGYVLCPSREMKKAMKDNSDWGESTVQSDFPHFFSKKCV